MGPRVVSVEAARCRSTEVEPIALSGSTSWGQARVLEFGRAQIETDDASGTWTYALLSVSRWYPTFPLAVEENPERLLVAYQTFERHASGGQGEAPPNDTIDALCAYLDQEIAVAIPDRSIGLVNGAPAPESVLAERLRASYVDLEGIAPTSILPPRRP